MMLHSLENVSTDAADESAGAVSRLYEVRHSSDGNKIDIGGFHADVSHLDDALKYKARLTQPWQALLVLDNEMWHEGRGPLKPLDPDKPACRNMLFANLRRPPVDGSEDVLLTKGKRFESFPTQEVISNAFHGEGELFQLDTDFYWSWRGLNLVAKQLEESDSGKAILEQMHSIRVRLPQIETLRQQENEESRTDAVSQPNLEESRTQAYKREMSMIKNLLEEAKLVLKSKAPK